MGLQYGDAPEETEEVSENNEGETSDSTEENTEE